MKIDHLSYGVSYRQYDHWSRKGWIRASNPGGSGHDRDFTKDEVRIFEIMADLVAIGFRPIRAAEIARDAIDRGYNGNLRILRGELYGTGFLSARAKTIPPESTLGTRTG